MRDDAGNLTSGFTNITVTNTAPVIESFTANATRNMKDGRFYADLNAVASDPDGDAVHLEWSSEYQQDGYVPGDHGLAGGLIDKFDGLFLPGGSRAVSVYCPDTCTSGMEQRVPAGLLF